MLMARLLLYGVVVPVIFSVSAGDHTPARSGRSNQSKIFSSDLATRVPRKDYSKQSNLDGHYPRFSWNDLDLSRPCVGGDRKCYFPSKNEDGMGFLVSPRPSTPMSQPLWHEHVQRSAERNSVNSRLLAYHDSE